MLVTVLLAPLLQGTIIRFEERVRRVQGPDVFQPNRDLWRLYHKPTVVPETAAWLYRATSIVIISVVLTAPILVPVLTNYPQPLFD